MRSEGLPNSGQLLTALWLGRRDRLSSTIDRSRHGKAVIGFSIRQQLDDSSVLGFQQMVLSMLGFEIEVSHPPTYQHGIPRVYRFRNTRLAVPVMALVDTG